MNPLPKSIRFVRWAYSGPCWFCDKPGCEGRLEYPDGSEIRSHIKCAMENHKRLKIRGFRHNGTSKPVQLKISKIHEELSQKTLKNYEGYETVPKSSSSQNLNVEQSQDETSLAEPIASNTSEGVK